MNMLLDPVLVGTLGAPMSSRPILGSARVLPVATVVALTSILLIGTLGRLQVRVYRLETQLVVCLGALTLLLVISMRPL